MNTCSTMLFQWSWNCVTFCYLSYYSQCVISLAAVGVPQGVSLERLTLQGAVRVTWSPPTDLCWLTNPQYTIQFGRTTSTPTTHSRTPSSSPFAVTGLEVGQQYFVRLAVRTQSGSCTFNSWESVTICKGVILIYTTVLFWIVHSLSIMYSIGILLRLTVTYVLSMC